MLGDDTSPVKAAPFEKLPDEIIEQILSVSDPNAFASLILLNQKWRAISQRTYLYLHHLSQCLSFSTNPTRLPSSDDANLPALRRLFAREVKRNLFDAYLRPRETIVKLVSTSISSSSCPGGEGMHFTTSARSQHLLAYNSSRIYVIDMRGSNVEVKRELKILRRPVAACIKDDATLLAVLSTELQVDIYDLQVSPPRRKQSIILDNPPRTIALSPCGSVLAAAYEGGIEVSSLNPDAAPSGRRSVKCDGVDSLSFSFDGTQLLGTTTHSSPPSTVILTAPYYDPGSQLADDNISTMWTTSILFPNSSRDCSHAVFIQDGSQEEASWTFAYDNSFESFRAVRIDDLRNGTTYFTGPVPHAASPANLLPSTLPGATYRGELISAGFHGKEVWVYGVPQDLDAVSESASLDPRRHSSEHSTVSRNASSRGRAADGVRVPQWKLLCDKLRNTFHAGLKVSEVPGVSNVKWVAGYSSSSFQERLIVTASGVSGPRLVTDEEDINFLDGGRIVIVDFDYGLNDGGKVELTIELGTADAEVLEEEQRDLETEVAIVRRRTVAQRRDGRAALLRAATSARELEVLVPSLTQSGETDDPLIPRRIGQNPNRSSNLADTSGDSPGITIEEQEAMDAPYAHASPRSAPTLRRAATAAAVNRIVHPRTADGRPIEYRRADGRREHPHESDADNWVPPPPPYQKEDPGDLPAFMRGPAIAPSVFLSHTTLPAGSDLTDRVRLQAGRVSSLSRNGTLGDLQRNTESVRRRLSHHRTASGSTAHTRPLADEPSRPRSSPSVYGDIDDLYDVSPPDSPRVVAHESDGCNLSQGDRRIISNSSIASNISPQSETSEPNPVILVQSSEPSQVSPSILGNEAQTIVPALEVQVHDGFLSTSSANNQPTPVVGRLSNTQTWPGGARSESKQVHNWGHSLPSLAPVSHSSIGGCSSVLPPLPSSSQIASLSHRISMGNPRRLSGGFHVPGTSIGAFNYQQSELNRQGNTDLSTSWNNEIDQPLIISTPKGVPGAFDPLHQQSSARFTATPLVSPVPQYPRSHEWPHSPRPMVERLETIYSVASQRGQQLSHSSQIHTRRRLLLGWRRSPTGSIGAVPVGVNRQPSRAGRSAAMHLKEARKRGWNPKKGKKKKKNYEAASSAGWTDVSTTSTLKEKKCILM